MKRFLPYYKHLKQVKWQFVIAVLAGAVFGVASGAGLPLLMQKVLPEMFAQKEISLLELFLVALYMPAVFLVRGASQFVNTYYISYCGYRVLEYIQIELYGSLQKLPLKFFRRIRVVIY